jgi:glycosyltransferase involved in cell wall biosynthesis
MRMGINVSLVSDNATYRRTGVSRYISELVSAMQVAMPTGDTLIRLGSEHNGLREWPPARIVWEQTALAVRAHALRVDVLHSPVNVAPLTWRGPSVVTVHDLAFLQYPKHLSARRRAWLRTAVRLSVQRADRVIAVSQSTADDLVSWLDLPRERVAVIHSAPSPAIRAMEGAALERFRRRNMINRPFVLAVGTLEPRKNLPTLLGAFAKVKHAIPHDLVVVGPPGWLTGELQHAVRDLDLGGRLRMTGFVSDVDLGGWYSAADLFAFPSYYEGFGLPAVEAMRCGVPVLASDTSCFPEVVGDAGVLLPPDDVQGWADTMTTLLQDSRAREEMAARGQQRASRFTWERTVALTRATYGDAVGLPHRGPA